MAGGGVGTALFNSYLTWLELDLSTRLGFLYDRCSKYLIQKKNNGIFLKLCFNTLQKNTKQQFYEPFINRKKKTLVFVFGRTRNSCTNTILWLVFSRVSSCPWHFIFPFDSMNSIESQKLFFISFNLELRHHIYDVTKNKRDISYLITYGKYKMQE